MIKKFLSNLFIAFRIGSGLAEKSKFFMTLSKFGILSAFQKDRTSVKLEGYTVNGSSVGTLDYLYREIFVFKEYNFKSNDASPVILDCGSNIGMAMLFFKKNYPDSHVMCFEANPFVFDILKKNAVENKLSGVEVFNVALSDKEEDISFYLNEDVRTGTMVGSIRTDRGGKKEVKCKGAKLSTFIKSIDRISLLKMDVEGAEWQVIADLNETNSWSKIDEIILEYHHMIEGERSRLSEFLKTFEVHGFDYNINTQYKEQGQFQDIRIHFFRQNR